MAARYAVRRATLDDAAAIAAVFSPSLRLLDFLPMLHSVVEDRAFIAGQILPACDVFVAEDEGGIVAFAAVEDAELRLLHTHPDHIGRGAGSLLIEAAKAGRKELELWCFQANAPARRFYERRGFRAIRFTDGARNEEKTPDMRYRWESTPLA